MSRESQLPSRRRTPLDGSAPDASKDVPCVSASMHNSDTRRRRRSTLVVFDCANYRLPGFKAFENTAKVTQRNNFGNGARLTVRAAVNNQRLSNARQTIGNAIQRVEIV